MTKRQRLALSSMIVSGNAMVAHTTMSWWMVIWVAVFLVATHFFTQD
jgi:hypothetical protein